MDKKNLVKRLLTFFIGIPLVVCLLLIDFEEYLVLNLCMVIISLLGANEFFNMASNKVNLKYKALFLTLTGCLPLLSYIFILAGISSDYMIWVYTIEVIFIMAVECFGSQEFTDSLTVIATSAFGIFYCGYLLTFVCRLSHYENAGSLLILFFLFVFMCDSGAWFFGVLLGKNNRGIFKASPNKSIAGFLGGIITDIALVCVLKLVFPDQMTNDYWRYIILAGGTALAGIIGDLIESTLKRSCEVKDSGNLIPGRGGMLDCMDSIILAIPAFYILFHFLLVQA